MTLPLNGADFLCLDGTERSCSSEPVHDSQTNPFGGNNLAENHFHSFIIQLTKDIEQPVSSFGWNGGRTDIMRMTVGKEGDVFRKTKYAGAFA
jgi:hypothetical protein